MTQPIPEDMEPASLTEAQSGVPPAGSSSFWRHVDWIFSAIICLVVLLFFFKTCFAGGSISRLCVLAEWDSVFDAWRTGRPQPYDPSLVQIFLPDYLFLARNLCKLCLPLWNPYCGLGYPFVGDIQSSMFAPLRTLFDFLPNLRTYNLYLICEILVCGLASYFLARMLLQPPGRAPESSRQSALRQAQPALLSACLASLFAAIAYTFCPYNLWYLELNLGSSAALFPLTTLAFVNAAQARTPGSAVLAGVVSGILIISGHPECSFFGISLACALAILLLLLAPSRSVSEKIASVFKLLALSAPSAVAVSAPSLFPFAEYLLNAESYKYGSAYSTPVSWNGILFNLSNPGQNGASPYLGIIAAVALPLSLLALRKGSKHRVATLALLVLTGFSFLLVSQLGPLQALFSRAPLTALITRYALPYLLLLLSLLAAVGLCELAEICTGTGKHNDLEKADTVETATNSRLTTMLAAAAVLIVLPALMFFWSHSLAHNQAFLRAADFDAMLPATAWNAAAARRDLVCTAIFSLSALVCFFGQSRITAGKDTSSQPSLAAFRYLGSGLVLIALALGFISEASLSRLSLPLQAKFFYPPTELTARLQNTPFRCMSTCDYVLRPATNAVYGINFLTCHNPLFPRRFLPFLKACGAQTDLFNQKFTSKVSTLLDLASVKYVLSLVPLEDASGRTQERFQLVYKSPNNIMIYENRDAAPRAYLVGEGIPAGSGEEALKKIQSPDFDPTATVVVESAGSNSTDARTSNSVRTSQAVVIEARKSALSSSRRYEEVTSLQLPDANTVRITCQPQAPSWLVLTDIYYPGWHAYADSKNVLIARANYAFRAVRLEKGKHEVVFAYEPYSFYAGCGIFAAFTILCVLAPALSVYKRSFSGRSNLAQHSGEVF
jgi:hypothetical protein